MSRTGKSRDKVDERWPGTERPRRKVLTSKGCTCPGEWGHPKLGCAVAVRPYEYTKNQELSGWSGCGVTVSYITWRSRLTKYPVRLPPGRLLPPVSFQLLCVNTTKGEAASPAVQLQGEDSAQSSLASCLGDLPLLHREPPLSPSIELCLVDGLFFPQPVPSDGHLGHFQALAAANGPQQAALSRPRLAQCRGVGVSAEPSRVELLLGSLTWPPGEEPPVASLARRPVLSYCGPDGPC